jgi:aldose 1-epimerase
MSQTLLLSHGPLSLALCEEGGACTSLRWQARGQAGFEVLEPRPAGSVEVFKQASFALTPYSNRLFGGQLITPDATLTLPNNHPAQPMPLHGVGWRLAWQLSQRSADSAELRYHYQPDAHWPFEHECSQQVRLSPTVARFEMSLRNLSPGPMPAGLGFHPCFALEEDSLINFAAASVWTQDSHGRPQTEAASAGKPRFDFAAPRQAMDVVQDHCHAHWQGTATLTHPARRISVTLTASPELDHLMIYRQPGMPWLCVEPVSHATGAFSLPGLNQATSGARWLQAGESLTVWMELRLTAT